jgi:hypothetical protein
MGLSRIFKYQNEKQRFVADLCLHGIVHLLHPLASIFRKPGLGCRNILNRRLDWVCDDGPYDVLVLARFKVDG